MKINITERYFLFILLIITVILTLLIIYPFLTMFVLASAFAVVLRPLYLRIKKHVTFNISWLASLLTVILFLICLCVPLFFIGKAVFGQAQNMYENVIMNSDNSSNFINHIETSIDRFFPSGFGIDIHSKIASLTSSLTNSLARLFTSTFNSIVMFVLMIFTLFYILKDGEKWEKEVVKVLPLSDDNTNEIINNLKKSINRIFKGSFFIAIAQGLLAWIGFTIFGVPNAAIWAVVAGVASFIPTLGTSVVSVPAMFFLFFTGMQWQALGLLIWSAVLIGMVDNFLSPYIISKNTEVPSLFILFSILGGVSLMGPVGILIGPLVVSLLYSLVVIYKKEINANVA